MLRRGQPYYLVVFETPGARGGPKARAEAREKKGTPRSRIGKLEEELSATREYLHTTLQCPELPALITETIDSVLPIERTVEDDKNETYLLRIRPYKTPDNRIDGAVIALFDLDPVRTWKESGKSADS